MPTNPPDRLTTLATRLATTLRAYAAEARRATVAHPEPELALLSLARKLDGTASELEHALAAAAQATRRPVAAGDERLWRSNE